MWLTGPVVGIWLAPCLSCCAEAKISCFQTRLKRRLAKPDIQQVTMSAGNCLNTIESLGTAAETESVRSCGLMFAAPGMSVDDREFPVMVFPGRCISGIARRITVAAAVTVFVLPEEPAGGANGLLGELIHAPPMGSAQRSKGAQCSKSCLHCESGMSKIVIPWAAACT